MLTLYTVLQQWCSLKFKVWLPAVLLLAAGVSGAAEEMGGEHQHAGHDGAIRSPVFVSSEVTYLIPDIMLVNKEGGPVSIVSELDTDAPVLLNFIFTTCTVVCPVTSQTFSRVQTELMAHGERFRMISISIDPEQDTPDRLRNYAEKYNAGAEWHFLTGGLEASQLVQKAFNAYRGSKMNHVPVTYLRTKRGDRWLRYDGFISAGSLLREYRKMVAEN